ncbi:MAG: hypothetical protein JWN52_1740, partial [Actinomycetia bacterium]|nr:hypothetical protein [Actinomycetes bacterium]
MRGWRIGRRILRTAAWGAAFVLGLAGIFLADT